MKNPIGERGSQWFWSGVTLLSVSAFVWLMAILATSAHPGIGVVKAIAGLGVLVACIPAASGVYCVERGKVVDVAAPEDREALKILVKRTFVWQIMIAIFYIIFILFLPLPAFLVLVGGLVLLVLANVPLALWTREKGFLGIKAIKDSIARIDLRVEALREHLKQIGLDATVESKNAIWAARAPVAGAIIGTVRVANRNIDLIGLEEFGGYTFDMGSVPPKYRCVYVVQARVEGLEDRLKVECKPVTARKSFLSKEIVDIKWKGKGLAQMLSSDVNLRNMLYRMNSSIATSIGLSKTKVFLRLEIKPSRKHQCVGIRQKGGFYSPDSAFPTVETFEAFDRIAHHVRSVANILPNTQSSKDACESPRRK